MIAVSGEHLQISGMGEFERSELFSPAATRGYPKNPAWPRGLETNSNCFPIPKIAAGR